MDCALFSLFNENFTYQKTKMEEESKTKGLSEISGSKQY
jgi:hypothetical protein